MRWSGGSFKLFQLLSECHKKSNQWRANKLLMRCDLSVVLFCIMVGSAYFLFFCFQYVFIHLINARIMEYIKFFIILFVLVVFVIIIIIILRYGCLFHRPFLPGTSLEPAVIPTAIIIIIIIIIVCIKLVSQQEWLAGLSCNNC